MGRGAKACMGDSPENSPAIFIRGGELGSWVTVGELPSAETCLSNMPSLKAKKRGKRAPEKALLGP
jgi:hypothetical protein